MIFETLQDSSTVMYLDMKRKTTSSKSHRDQRFSPSKLTVFWIDDWHIKSGITLPYVYSLVINTCGAQGLILQKVLWLRSVFLISKKCVHLYVKSWKCTVFIYWSSIISLNFLWIYMGKKCSIRWIAKNIFVLHHEIICKMGPRF